MKLLGSRKVSTSSETTGSQRLIKYNSKTIAKGRHNQISYIKWNKHNIYTIHTTAIAQPSNMATNA